MIIQRTKTLKSGTDLEDILRNLTHSYGTGQDAPSTKEHLTVLREKIGGSSRGSGAAKTPHIHTRTGYETELTQRRRRDRRGRCNSEKLPGVNTTCNGLGARIIGVNTMCNGLGARTTGTHITKRLTFEKS